MYAWLLFGHLVGVVFLVTGVGVYAVSVEGFRGARTAADLRILMAQLKVGERTLTAGGPFLIIAGLILAGRFWSFFYGWIAASILLLAAWGIVVVAVDTPRIRRIDAALRQAGDGGLPADLAAAVNDRVLLVVNRAAIGLIIEIMFLMTLKPRTPGILVSLLVTAALVAAACRPFLVRPSAGGG